METFAVLLLLAAIGASHQASPIPPTPGGKPVTCQTQEEDSNKFNQGGGLLGYVMREAPKGELAAGTWKKILERDWGDSTLGIKKIEEAIGKPLDQAGEDDVKKIVDEFGVVVAVPSYSARVAMTLYTEAAWPPPLSMPGLGWSQRQTLVARYSLIGDHAGKVRVMRCTVPPDTDIQPDYVARLVGPGEEVPTWLQRLMKTDPRVAQLDFRENGKKLSRLVAPAEQK